MYKFETTYKGWEIGYDDGTPYCNSDYDGSNGRGSAVRDIVVYGSFSQTMVITHTGSSMKCRREEVRALKKRIDGFDKEFHKVVVPPRLNVLGEELKMLEKRIEKLTEEKGNLEEKYAKLSKQVRKSLREQFNKLADKYSGWTN